MRERARLTIHQLRYEQRAFWRTPAELSFTFALPVIMLVVFAALNSSTRVSTFYDRPFVGYLVPALQALGVIVSAYGNLASRLASRRETGQLKRFHATPLPKSAYLAGSITHSVLVSLLIATIVLGLGWSFYDVQIPSRWPELLVVLTIGSIAFCALGLALATFIPSSHVAQTMVIGTTVPLLFISGIFQAVPKGSALAWIASVFPVRHLLQATLDVYAEKSFPWLDLLVIVTWGVLGAAVAARRFRWSPRNG